MEKLHNNVLLADNFKEFTSDAQNVPYLKNPPKVIDVTVGRQLFVDGFLIEKTTLKAIPHEAKKYENNPVLKPETEWEKDGLPVACPKDGGVWYDEEEGVFKAWYEAGWLRHMCYATSKDGITWERPNLGIVGDSNIILPYEWRGLYYYHADESYLRPDSTTVWVDYECDKSQKYKLFLRNPSDVTSPKIGDPFPAIVATSADGIHFENFRLTKGGMGDRSTAFYNPFRKKWAYSLRSGEANTPVRVRKYWESDDFLSAGEWELENLPTWMKADEKDEPNPYLGQKPQLYNFSCIAYESIIFGLCQLHFGPNNSECEKYGVPKITELQPAYSRDGYHFSRPHRVSIVRASMYEGAWDRGYVQSVGGGLIVCGDEMRLYYTGFAGDKTRVNTDGAYNPEDWVKNGMYANGATGFATLRRDGFVSMDGKGELLTRTLTMQNKSSLHINAVGFVCVEILDESGTLLAVSEKFCGDSTNAKLQFPDFEVQSLNGKNFRLHFKVDGSLYAFGFADKNGEFGGRRAAGIR